MIKIELTTIYELFEMLESGVFTLEQAKEYIKNNYNEVQDMR